MAAAPKFKKMTTPKGTALYPNLNSPDTKFVPEGVYSCKMVFDPSDPEWAAFKEKICAMVDEVMEYYKAEKPKVKKKLKAHYPFVEETDENGEETGREIFQTPKQNAVIRRKSDDKIIKMTVPLFDSKGKEIDPKAMFVGNGTVLKCAIQPAPFHKNDDNSVGLALRLKAVQVIQVASGPSFADMGFEEEEDGFEFDEEQAVAQQQTDNEEVARFDNPAPEAGTEDDTDF